MSATTLEMYGSIRSGTGGGLEREPGAAEPPCVDVPAAGVAAAISCCRELMPALDATTVAARDEVSAPRMR